MEIEVSGETAEWLSDQLAAGRFGTAQRAVDYFVWLQRDEDARSDRWWSERSPEEIADLERRLQAAEEDFEAGRVHPAEEVFAEIRARLAARPITHVAVHPDDAPWLAEYRDRHGVESADEVVRFAIQLLRERDAAQAQAPAAGEPVVPEPAPGADAPAATATPSGANDEVDLDHELFAAVRERLRARGPQVF